MDYSEYVASIRGVQDEAASVIEHFIREWYHETRGERLVESLPQKYDPIEYDDGTFQADIDPENRSIYNIRWKERVVYPHMMAAFPERYIGLGDAIKRQWNERYPDSYQDPDLPDEVDGIDEQIEELSTQLGFILENPQLEDLLTAIGEGHSRAAAKFLDEDPDGIIDPTSRHEMRHLFANGQIHVIYFDEEIALFKPEYNRTLRAEVASDQSGNFMVRIDDMPEPAYVVGVDDTPTGLFAHMVDGTNLRVDQEVDRATIHDVMGFDQSYDKEPWFDISDQRIRLQGDLAVRGVSDSVGSDATERCNLPIDNHLILMNGRVVGDADEEPVRVHVSEKTSVNIIHDEHEQVITTLPSGAYEFYLLERGVRRQGERPTW